MKEIVKKYDDYEMLASLYNIRDKERDVFIHMMKKYIIDSDRKILGGSKVIHLYGTNK